MKANISVCLICKNEEKNLESCLLSLRDYVEEIVVVDTGSTDSSVSIAKKYADIVEVCTDYSDSEGNLINFAKARNKAKDLATKEWMLWVDCDDELVGANKLHEIINRAGNTGIKQILLPYEYSRDANGDVNCLHYRERLVFPKNQFNWVNPVHEVLLGPESLTTIVNNDIKVVHKRVEKGKITDPYRNFKIIKQYVDEIGESDPRQLYYLGLEYGNIHKFEDAIKTLSRYVELSGWDDEKCLAALKVAEHYVILNNLEAAITWGSKALNIKPNWCEPYLFLGKMHYTLAQQKEAKKENAFSEWEHCVNFIKVGLSLPPTNTLLFINPKEREFEIHKYLNFALSKINDIDGAIASATTGLARCYDEGLERNLKFYKQLKANLIIEEQFNYLKANNLISDKQLERIYTIMSNKELKLEEFEPYKRSANYPKDVKQEDFPVAKKSPHKQAWSIPEGFVYDDLPLIMNDEQLKALVMALYKEYMFHDEVLSAKQLLENAPYRVRHSVEIEDALKSTNKFIEWIDDKEQYDLGNSTIDLNGNLLTTDMTPLTHDLAGQANHRFVWLTDRMPDKSKSILDMACIDGQMTNRWGLKGYTDINGVDCCTNSIKIAKEKAQEFNTGAKHYLSYFNEAPDGVLKDKKFDIITCGDVYEHLLNPVKDLLVPARKLVKEDGKMLMVTPHGAWFRGQFHPGAHPWLWGQENEHWLSEKQRGHVIAPTVWTVAKHFRDAGWYVKDCTAVAQWRQDVPNQGNVCVEAYPNPPTLLKKKTVVFNIGNGYETYTPHSVNLTGIGGSETAAIKMAEEFAKKGYDVKVYNSCGPNGEGIYNGVEYYVSEKCDKITCDILIGSRNAELCTVNVKAKKKYLWVHDVIPYNLSEDIYNNLDGIFVLSEWHKNNVKKHYTFVKDDKLILTTNGVDLERFNKNIQRDPYKVVISSSPDRYLPSLLQMWGRIKKEVPEASLHICYGFENWEFGAKNDSNQTALIKRLKQMLSDMKALDVNYVGRLNQNRLAEEMMSAGAWLYSTWFAETNCQLKGSLIFTKNGMKRIEDIEVGDLVLTHKGRFKKVTELIRKEYDGDIYTFKRRKDKLPITVTKEHPLYTTSFNLRSDSKGNAVYNMNNKKTGWKVPSEIKENIHYLMTPKMPFGNLQEIYFSDYLDLKVKDGYILPLRNHSNYKIIENKIKITEEFMYMLGLFAAEGCASPKRGKQKEQFSCISFAMHSKEYDKAKRVLNFFGSGKITKISNNGISAIIHHSIWAKFLNKTIGIRSAKKIPDFVWDCSKEMQKAFFLGAFEGDGCKTHTTLSNNAKKQYRLNSYSSISPSLAYGISQLLANQGIFCSVYYNEKRKNYDLLWQENSKVPQHYDVGEGFVTKIDKITKTKFKGEVFNFEVEEDHSYVTDRTIVHNCISAIEAQAAGMVLVTSPIAALKETACNAEFVEGDWLSPEYQDNFVKKAVKALKFTTNEQRNKNIEFAKKYAWSNVAKQWEEVFFKDSTVNLECLDIKNSRSMPPHIEQSLKMYAPLCDRA